MTVRERMLALRIIEIAERNPAYAQKIGVTATLRNTGADEDLFLPVILIAGAYGIVKGC